jgi:predicted O-methyltransferase YrrM
MLDNIPQEVLRQMRRLEGIDARDRRDGTDRNNRLRQITPETGRFLAIMAAGAPDGSFVEVGTSAGYSGLYLSLACRAREKRLVTIEISDDKVRLAAETFRMAGVDDLIDIRVGDARQRLREITDIAFCFLDAEKEVYRECYDIIVPAMVTGGLLVADNIISHAHQLQPVVDQAVSDPRVDAVVVPIGKGELVCRKC